MQIFMTRYQVVNPLLKPLIKYYWLLESDSPVALQHKLLPVNNIDIIINLSNPIQYIKNATLISAQRFHFNGIRNKHCFICQQGKVSVIGISFFPYGLYPFLKIPISEFRNETVGLSEVVGDFVNNIQLKFQQNLSMEQRINIIEGELLKTIDLTLISPTIIKLFRSFYLENSTRNINSFCQQYGVNIK